MIKAPNGEFRVFCFGDSICFGQGVSPHLSWVTRIAEALALLGKARRRLITVQNPSVNGNTTRQALERMAYDIQAHEPDVLLLQFGMNDCNYWETDRGHPRVSPKAFLANLEEILERGWRCGVRHALMLTNHPSGRTEKNLPCVDFAYEDSNRRYNTLIREVAVTGGSRVTLVDVEAAIIANTGQRVEAVRSLLLDDLVHLGPRGHDLYVETVEPIIRDVIIRYLDD